MTDQKPDSGDNNLSTDNEATPPDLEEAETASEQPEEAETESPADEAEDAPTEEDAPAEEADAVDGEATEADADASAEEESPGVIAETEAEAADAAAAGAAWTTTPVAPDPEATEAALAALAAKPEVTLEPPESPPMPPPGDEPPDEGTPVLLVGGILVGAFIVALAIVLILFRPFDNLNDVDASLSPSPVVTEVPSESPSAIATVGTPDFSGMLLEEAETTATDSGLVVRVNPVETDEEEPGTVLDQDPAAGEPVEEGSTVELAVARAVPTNSVPDVSGLSEEDATSELENAGFVVGEITEEFSDEVETGTVISTDPAIDSELPQGSEVDLVVSAGPEFVPVPDIIDLSEADALDALDEAGLAAGAMTEASDGTIVAGNVISSDPAADTEVAPGTEVAYVLSTGPALTAVPDIIDLSEADALDALDEAGLAAGAMTEASDGTIVAGNVISSDPAADTEVAPGTEVAYVLSTGPALTAVPDIIDLSEADALDALDEAGLAAGAMTEASDGTIVAGNVISSDPAADTEVAPGTEVAYVLSTGPALTAVPDIIDLSEADALDALDEAGLAAGAMTEASDGTIVAGNVISSDPAADTEVAPGTEVAYVLSTGPALTAVPDIIDLSEADALDALDEAGLAAGAMTEASDGTIVAGNVISSDPAADTEVAPGTEVAYVLSTGPELTAVPDLSGAAADAADAITAAGLTVGDTSQAYSDTVAAGDVINQNPAAGTEVDLGSAVSYVESLGVEQVEVPDLSGASADVETKLADAGLTVGDTSQAYSDTVAAGDVINQNPAAGTEVDLGSAVDYVVSLGVETVPVPDLSGAAADAADAITAAGLTVGAMTEEFSDTVAAGDVINQNPAAGTEVDLGSAVDYVVSLGVETVPVPDLSGAAADAADAITAAGLTVGDTSQAFSDTVAAGDVINQNPAAGTEVDLGSAVSYVESLGVEQVEVPDLSGAAADAADAITAAGLTVGDTSQAFSDTVAAGDVINQNPAAGESADLGSAVSYVESLGVEQVEVPDLSGASADVETKLADAGLTVGDTSQAYSDTVAAGDVINQNPAAGTEVDLGSAVDYVVSLGVETVPVPDLSGAAADAADAITAAGLTVGDTSQAFSDTVAAGDVINQNPAAGTEVDLGSAVSYVESLGVEQVEVPDLSGAAADAADAITAAGLTVGDTSQAFSDTVAAGDVINQNPAAGESADLGSAVSYVESLGVEQVEVPDLSGAAADAADAITAAGLTVGDTSQAYSDTVAAGDVINQNPAAGTEVDLGSAVSYVESLGVEQVEVPDVREQSEADATTAIEATGLTVGEVLERTNANVPAGAAVKTEPAAGEMVDAGSAVTLTMSMGPKQVDVPDVVGMTEADATTAIEAADLTVGASSEENSDTIPAGSTISTSPAAGTTVDAKSSVDYVLSLGIEQVTVPDVVDTAEADAIAAIEAAGFVAGTVTNAFDETIVAGNVVSQDPASGSDADKGSTVDYLVSDGPTPFVRVPAVRDLSEADAIAAIEAAELTVGETITQTHEKVAAGNAIKTDPAEGEEIRFGSSVALYVSTGSNLRTVPDVSGQPAAEAQAALEAEDLAVTSDERTNAKVEKGNTVKTEPAAGTEVAVGDEITLVVSKGPKQVVIPDVVGMPRGEARTNIADAELKVGDETVVEDAAPVNTVIAQEPVSGGEADKNSTVDITVSSGPPQVVIPNIKNIPAADAQAALEAEGLTVSTQERNNAAVEAGNAVKTEPVAGTPVDAGSEVLLTISKGPKPAVVPDVVGSKKGAAATAITDAGLVVGAEEMVDDSAPSNTVIAQDPPAGSETPTGSSVNLTLSSGPPSVEIPAVKDTPAADAQATLEGLGLVVTTQERSNATVEAGSAVKTEPAAGEVVELGSEVLLTVSKGPKPAVVPDVVGSKKGAAATAITDAGLVVGAEETVEDSAPSNTVIGQDPPAGSETPTGSSVNLTISSGPPSVEIPAVKNTPATDAQGALEGLGLVVETVERSNASVAAGDAVKTEPAAGETVLVGSDVLLTISKGPKLAVVPDVVGSAQGAAESAITDAKLAVGATEVVDGDDPAGTVVSQEPAVGTEVPQGTAVDLSISAGPPQVEIPAVKDTAAAEAQGLLEGLGLVVETQERTNATVAAGNAVKTEPAAGELADVGSTVTLTVSKGPKQIAVPSIVGLKKGAANAAITDAGLQVGESTTVEDLAAANTVIAQDPAADSTVDQNSLVNYTISSGPPLVEIPAVKNESEARAVNALEGLGLVVETEQRSNATVAAGDAVKTDPAAGEMAAVGSTVTLTISKGPKQVTVPNLVGLSEADAQASITGAELTVGARAEADDASPAGTVVDQSPAEGSTLDKNSTVDYTVSRGPVIEPLGVGGDLASPEVSSQLDLIAAEIEPVRELELGNTPYDGSGERQQLLALAERVGILHDAGALKPEEKALKRLGLLDDGDDLAALLQTLYGQALPVAYFEDEGHISVVEPNDSLDASDRAEAAREFDRALADQQFGISNTRLSDKSRGDEALAGYALEQGDGTAAMLEWSSIHGDAGKTNDVIVPGDDGIYASMPLLLQREYSFPFLEGRNFVDRLRESGGWGSVNDAWNRPPESTEQILHPKLYPGERPTTVVMDGIAGRLGNGWKENWQQTMGELRTGVWLANGQPGEQSGPKAVVKLPRANAAAGWGGDRLVSLDGPDGQWAIVWQTKWDSQQDVEQFANAANAVIADLDGAGLVASADVSSGVSNPVLVLIASSDDTLASVAAALGVAVAVPS